MGFKPNIICETSQWNFMLEMVSINHGITILPLSDYHEFENLKLLPLMDPHVKWQLTIAWRKDSYISHATRTWIDFIKSKRNVKMKLCIIKDQIIVIWSANCNTIYHVSSQKRHYLFLEWLY